MDHERSSLESPSTSPVVAHLWLTRLRWAAFVGEGAFVTLADRAFHIPLAIGPLAALLLLTAVSNLYIRFKPRVVETQARVWVVLLFDSLVLTAVLWLSGGAANPFTVFYLVLVALGALLLDTERAVAIAVVTSLGFASLFLAGNTPASVALHHGPAFTLHLQGMWLAYACSASFVTFFVTKIVRALRERDAEVMVLQRRNAQAEKLASLSTLAAGAAHELGTPLSTIAVIAKELQNAASTSELESDARTIRAEIERCRMIVAKLAARAGDSVGEVARSVTLDNVVDDLRRELGDRASHVSFAAHSDAQFSAPREGLAQVLVNLVNNALDAQRKPLPIEFRAAVKGDCVEFEVRDQGEGVAAHIQARLGEPFVTTKPPGKGLGLGLFLVCAFAERNAGRFDLLSRSEGGTLARLALPRVNLS